MSSCLLKSARVVQSSIIVKASILIHDGRIGRIDNDDSMRSEREVDCPGLTIFPGFIDVHIHGADGIDVMSATAGDLSHVSQFLATQGVTGWLPTLVPAADEQYRSAISAIEVAAKTAQRGARIMGVHYEGPFVNAGQCGALHTQYFKTFKSADDLDQLPLPQPGVLAKMITLAPEIDGGLPLISELQRRGWIISIGHTRAEELLLDQAANAGARHMTHFMNAMPQLHHRQPGPVGWGLSRDDVTCDVIADGIHLHPLTLRVLMKAKGTGRLSLISDAIAAAGKGDGNYQIWGETISVKQGRTSNAAGSIAGSVITMLDAVRMMRSLGASEMETARMASENPAQLLGLHHDCGSIEVGKRADLVAIDEEGNVRLTIVGGEVVFEKKN
jgi:N-acetylglucosamine-6-phosphate deacetylase